MTSELYWCVPQHVLYWQLSGIISGDEIIKMSNFIPQQVKSSDNHKVHIIIDCSNLKQLNYNHNNAQDAFHRLANQDWMGNVVAIIRNDLLQMQMNSLSRAFGLEWKTVSSMHLAIRSLKESDRLLQNIPTIKPITLIKEPVQTPHNKR